MARHFSEFRSGFGWYPGERIGSWVSNSNGIVSPVEIYTRTTFSNTLMKLRADGVDEKALIPVGTYGTNASPSVLKKFEGTRERMPLAMLTAKGRVRGFDVVYEARTTVKGIVPFTMVKEDGVEPDFYVNFLTPDQLRRMHVTEGCRKEREKRVYDFGVLRDVELEDGTTMDVYLYTATGAVYKECDGKRISPASEKYERDGRPYQDFVPVNAEGRRNPERTQREMMDVFDCLARKQSGRCLYIRRGSGLAFNPELDGKAGSEERKRLDEIRGWLQNAHGVSCRLDLNLADPWDFDRLERPFR